jgi:glycosyltransferase involved in cell wall biosynthesis
MATYNGEKYIEAQLNSILCQLDKDDEIVISDDGSTDKTLEIVRSYQESRIKILHNTKRGGVIGNFENALTKANGEYIFLADQDDVWEENKVRVCLKNLEDCDVVVSDCAIVDADLKIITPSFFQKNNTRKGFLNNLYHNSYIGCCMAFRRTVLQKCLPFPKHIPMHDTWMGFVAELCYTTRFIPQVLVLYRRHGNNITPTSQPSQYGMLKKIAFRWNLIRYIPLLFLRKRKTGLAQC